MAEDGTRRRLEDLADSILDGRPIDWDAAESESSARDRSLLRRLRVVSAVATVHRTVASGRLPRIVEAPPLIPPSKWGALDVIEQVGCGSFGDVYRAWDPRLDREVALKLLYHHDGDPEAPASVISEGRLLARVRHPNVVTIHGADRIGGRVGLWMEFVRGRTLEQSLIDRGPFGPQEALLVGIDLCRALSAVHGAGLVHRDIKAQNVVREEGGRIVLMDFGTGREPSEDAAKPTLTGTPLYLAPELFKEQFATRQSDVYSLGVLLFHLVTRSYPVGGRSVGEVRINHGDGRRVWLRDLRPDLPERFITAIETALAVDPAARYQTAGEMERTLLAGLSGLDGASAAQTDSGAKTWTANGIESRGASRRRPMWIAFAGVAAVAVIGGLTLGPRLLVQTGVPPSSSQTSSLARGVVASGELTARRVGLPQTTFVGRPSPDGRYLSYVDLNGDLCLQDLATGQSRRLTNKGKSTESAESQIAISSDGTWIAYTWRTLDGTNEIRLVGEDGAWPRLLLRRPDVIYPSPLQWSADGRQILAMLELAGGDNQLVLISAATGAVKDLRTFSGGPYYAALSPDGAFVAFDQPQEDDPRVRDILVTNIEHAGTPRPVIQHPANDRFPMWTPDGRLLFVSDRTGSLALWAVRIAGDQPIGEPELLVRDVGRLTMPLGLTDGGALYYQLQNGMIDVYSQSIDPSGLTPPDDPKPVSPTLIGANISSEWSPDGRDLAYVSMRGLVQNDRYSRTLAIHNVESGRLRNLQPALTSFIEPRWSPDGRRILVRGSDLRNHEGIFIIDVISGHTQPALLFPPDAVQSAVFQWSPDGSAVWYDKSGAGAIVARDLATGREDVVFKYKDESIQRLMQWPGFRVSPDGRSVAYTGFTFHENKAGTVVAMRTIGGATQEIARADAPERVEFQDWTPDGGGMLLIKRNTRERTNLLYEFRLDGRPPRSLDVNVAAIRDVSLRRDGKSITYTAGMNSTEVWVLENLLSSSVGGAGRDH